MGDLDLHVGLLPVFRLKIDEAEVSILLLVCLPGHVCEYSFDRRPKGPPPVMAYPLNVFCPDIFCSFLRLVPRYLENWEDVVECKEATRPP